MTALSRRELLRTSVLAATASAASGTAGAALAAAGGFSIAPFRFDVTPPVACRHYACHPMSHYGQGHVSSDFVGLARKRRQTCSTVC